MGFIDHDSPYLDVLDYYNQTSGAQANIDALINYASEVIETECNRSFATADYNEAHTGDNQDNLVVWHPPINSLTSITFKSYPGNNLNPSGDVVVVGSNFLFDSGAGEIKWNMFQTSTISDFFGVFPYFGIFPIGFQNITVSYNGGFTSVPEVVKFICAEAVIEVFSREDAAFALTAEKLGTNYKKFAAQVIFNKRKQLHKYKLRIVP